jgi:hypothetical protein
MSHTSFPSEEQMRQLMVHAASIQRAIGEVAIPHRDYRLAEVALLVASAAAGASIFAGGMLFAKYGLC